MTRGRLGGEIGTRYPTHPMSGPRSFARMRWSWRRRSRGSWPCCCVATSIMPSGAPTCSPTARSSPRRRSCWRGVALA